MQSKNIVKRKCAEMAQPLPTSYLQALPQAYYFLVVREPADMEPYSRENVIFCSSRVLTHSMWLLAFLCSLWLWTDLQSPGNLGPRKLAQLRGAPTVPHKSRLFPQTKMETKQKPTAQQLPGPPLPRWQE